MLLCALALHLAALAQAAQLSFPLPPSAAGCPSFARYRALHRSALGQHALPDTRRWARRGNSHVRAVHHAQPGRRVALEAGEAGLGAHTAAAAGGVEVAAAAAGAQDALPRSHARWLVTADPDGIADRLVNAVSTFYYALLTDRVLCIQPASEEQPGLESALSAPNIDWTCAGAKRFPEPVVHWNPTEDDAWMDPHFDIYTTFVRSHLDAIGPHDAPTIALRMHRGITVALFNNPHHRSTMEALGLRPDTAFGCAVHFLFGLNPATQALVDADPELHALMLDEGAIKIGIQIRLGDDNILQQLERNGETELNERAQKIVGGFLQCAEQLQDNIKFLSGPDNPDPNVNRTGPPPGPPLRIYVYLMTDTLAVRKLAKAKFGDRLLALHEAKVQFYQNVTADGLRRTVLEHWYFSRCHHHVITGHSGMGRTAAFAGLRPGPSLFSMEIDDGSRLAGRGCSVWDADRPLDVYNTWSGV